MNKFRFILLIFSFLIANILTAQDIAGNFFTNEFQAFDKRFYKSTTDEKVWKIQAKIERLEVGSPQIETLYLEWYDLRKADGNDEKLAWVSRKLGEYYLAEQKYEKAFLYFEKFIELINTSDFSKGRFWLDYGHHFYHPQALKKEVQEIHDVWLLKYYQKAFDASQNSNNQLSFLAEMGYIFDAHIRYSTIGVNPEVLDFWIQILEHQNRKFDVVSALLLSARIAKGLEAEKYMTKAVNYTSNIKKKSLRKYALLQCANQYQNHFEQYSKCLEIKLTGYDSAFYNSKYFKNSTDILNYLKDPVEVLIWSKAPNLEAEKCILVLDNFLENHTKNEEKIWALRLKSRLLQYQKKYLKSAKTREKLLPLLGENPENDIQDFADTGFLFQLAKDKKNVLKYFEKAVKIAQNNYVLEIEIPKYISKIAYCFETFNDFENTEKQYLRAYNTAVENLPKEGNHVVFYNRHLLITYDLAWKISQFYEKTNRKEKALLFAKTSLEIAKNLPYQHRNKVEKSLQQIQKLSE